MSNMKKVAYIIVFSVGILIAKHAEAHTSVEYKTLKLDANASASMEIDVLTTDLVEVLSGTVANSSTAARVEAVFPDNKTRVVTLNSEPRPAFTGITKFRLLRMSFDTYVTIRITHAELGPTSVILLPENIDGNYDLMVESSDDTVTWDPFHSQSVQSGAAKKFFRVRIVRKQS